MVMATLKIGDLNPAKYNPRKISDKALEGLKKSIKTFGYVEPIIVNRQGNTVVGGHQRLKAMTELGEKEVEVVIVDLDEKKEKALNISLNNRHIAGEYDASMLADILQELETSLDEYEDLNFDLLAEDFKINFDDEPVGDKDSVPDMRPDPRIKPGDVIELGAHRLLCGDATMIDHVETLMQGELAALVVTDPPYNVAIQGGNHGDPNRKNGLKIENDSMSDSEFFQFLLSSYMSMFMSMADGAGIYVFHADTEGLNFRKAMIDSGFKLAQCCVWIKQSLVMGRQDYHWQHEPVLYGWKPTAAHHWYSDRKQTTVWHFDRPSRNEDHPTMKPVDLIEYPINNSSKVGEIVLDLFGGSGSTLIACESTKRACRTMELDPRYCQVIVDRWCKYTGKSLIYLNGEKVDWSSDE